MVVYNAYDQIAELIADLNPAKVMALKANKELQMRFEDLVSKSKESSLDNLRPVAGVPTSHRA